MMLMARLPRTLQPLTKSTLFKHPIVAPFLRLAHAVPIYRRQDAGGAAVDNAETFRAVSHALAAGGAILIFPEGVSQPEPALMTLRTGAARMALEAEAAGAPPVTLLPVGLVLYEPGTFRDGRGLILVGDPVETKDCVTLHRTDPTTAVHRLTDRLAEALKKQIVEAEDRETLRLLRVMERVWREESGVASTPASAEWLQRASRAYRWLRREAPADVQRFRTEVEQYADDLDELGITPATVGRTYAPSIVARYAAREILPLVLGVPLAALGIVLHALPYALLARPPADTEATYKLTGGLVLYPVAWLFQAWLAWRWGGGGALALYLVLLFPAGFFALAWQARVQRVTREARALGHFLARRGLHERLAERRRELAEELEALARRVPEPVLSGQAS
jgi:glycerol-3-phosphate O-acyltransferase / dihydroxyacetone phosphate acyltransferase